MELEIRDLQKKDISKAIDFAIIGMNFNKYTENKLALRLVGRFFLYSELEKATHILAAYLEEKLVGVLILDMKNKQKKNTSFWRQLYIRFFDIIMKLVTKDANDEYDLANKQMLKEYLKKANPDGEISFLAADPTIQGKGIGTLLLNEISKLEKDKLLYLYTDSNCTYQFYERRGFERSNEKMISMELMGKIVTLTCFLYSKQF